MHAAKDLYLKTTDPTGKGSEIISHHRVWDQEKFLVSQRSMYEKKRDTPDFRVVSPATEQDYRKFKNYRVI